MVWGALGALIFSVYLVYDTQVKSVNVMYLLKFVNTVNVMYLVCSWC